MDRATKSRKRGVCLNEIGLRTVQSALETLWSQDVDGGKLTRERKAQFMGLSVGTAEKVLRGSNVDRATLVFVFKNLNLAWSEDFLLSVEDDPKDSFDAKGEPQVPSNSTFFPGVTSRARLSPLTRKATKQLKVAIIAFAGIAVVYGSKTRMMSMRPLDGERAFHRGEYQVATAIATSLRMRVQDSDSASTLCETLRLEGDLLVAKGDYLEAKNCFSRGLAIKKSLGNETLYASSFEAIGDCELHLGNLDQALSMFQQSLALYSKENDTTGVVMAKRGIASVYSRLRKLHESLQILDSCRELLLSQPVSPGRLALEADLANRKATAYCLLGSYRSAISISQQSLTFWKSEGHPRWIAVCEAQLGYIYEKSGNHQRAKAHLLRAAIAFRKLGDPKSMAAIAQELS